MVFVLLCQVCMCDSAGYYGEGLNAIIVFTACYLPDSSCTEYHYIMENLFLWVWEVHRGLFQRMFSSSSCLPIHLTEIPQLTPPLLNHTHPPTLRYVVSSLEMLVAEDYLIIYMNGGTPRSKMPGIGWLKKCYQMIDRRYESVCRNASCLYSLCDACMTQTTHNEQRWLHCNCSFLMSHRSHFCTNKFCPNINEAVPFG